MSKNLYQKYRPYTFDEVIGQKYVKTILLNSIKENMIQNTYLFNGPRGTGKTTIARIFSRLINCDSKENPGSDDCQVCKYFEETKEYDDIFELDAASNNGVDDIRKIIDSVKYQPIHLKKKVYIIDEVHMLSKGAFNALLKTLEEPQDKVVFILATTEVGKIPPTILSRCQRFDFERIPLNTLVELFEGILTKEEIAFDAKALETIAQLSDGCVRDGLSLLQKVISVSQNVTQNDVNEALGLVENEKYEKVLEYITNKNTDGLLEFWNELYLGGLNINTFIVDFQYYLKNKLLEESSYEILKIIYKINDIEQRAVYTKNLNSLIEVMFIELTNEINIPINSSQHSKVNYEEKFTNTSKNISSIKNNSINIQSPEVEVSIRKQTNVNKEEMPINRKTDVKIVSSSSTSHEIDEDSIFNILDSASKDKRIKMNEAFINVGERLQSVKKFGLAKFFLEGQIKAANDKSIIVQIEEELKDSFIKRHDKLVEEIEEVTTIKIISSTQWENLKVDFINRQKNGTLNEKSESIKTDEKDQEIINKIESKLNKKITVIKE